MATADVTVFGAGVFGLSVAWACAARGARVQVIDPTGPGAGASGGVVGALAPHAPEQWTPAKAFQLQALALAEDFWAEVAEAGGVDPGYARTGRLQPLADAAAIERAQARATTAATLWPDSFRWEIVAADAAGPLAPISATGLLIRDTLSARLSPRGAVAALVAAVRARGGAIVTEGAPEGRVVHATGWAGLMADGLGGGVKGQAAILAHAAPDAAQVYAGGVHVVPHADGTVAIGSTSERNWAEAAATDAQLDAVIAAARAAVPVLADAAVVARWAGVRPRTPSRQPILGPHPARPGDFIANGGFKIGFGLAPLVGAAMADLILDGKDAIPAPFRA